jgi:hypothetical protein
VVMNRLEEELRRIMTTIIHEPVLTHDMSGTPIHYVHEISVPRGFTPDQPGFQYRYGWHDRDGSKWDVYSKCVPVREEK